MRFFFTFSSSTLTVIERTKRMNKIENELHREHDGL